MNQIRNKIVILFLLLSISCPERVIPGPSVQTFLEKTFGNIFHLKKDVTRDGETKGEDLASGDIACISSNVSMHPVSSHHLLVSSSIKHSSCSPILHPNFRLWRRELLISSFSHQTLPLLDPLRGPARELRTRNFSLSLSPRFWIVGQMTVKCQRPLKNQGFLSRIAILNSTMISKSVFQEERSCIWTVRGRNFLFVSNWTGFFRKQVTQLTSGRLSWCPELNYWKKNERIVCKIWIHLNRWEKRVMTRGIVLSRLTASTRVNVYQWVCVIQQRNS